MTLRDLSEKDVIQLKTGENLGRIDDLAFEDGQITQVACTAAPECSACWGGTMICSFPGPLSKP